MEECLQRKAQFSFTRVNFASNRSQHSSLFALFQAQVVLPQFPTVLPDWLVAIFYQIIFWEFFLQIDYTKKCFRVLLTEIVWPFLRSVTRCWNKKKPKVSKQCSKRSHSSFYLKSNSFRSSLEKCKIFGRKIVVKNFQKWPNLVTLVVGLMPDIIFRANFVAPRGECYKTFYRFPPKFRNWTWGFCYAWTFTKKVNSWQVLNKNII